MPKREATAGSVDTQAAEESVEYHYVGDGTTYVIGHSTDPTVTLTGSAEEVEYLTEQSEAYALGPAPAPPKPPKSEATASEEVPA